MGRPPVGKRAMTSAERQRRYRAKLVEIVDAERVLAALSRAYDRAYFPDQDAIRAGVKKLLRRWDKDAAARSRWWRKTSAAVAKRTRKKRQSPQNRLRQIVISLIVMIIVGWLLARWLLREPVYFEPPAPSVA
jgi:hypothetical protein